MLAGRMFEVCPRDPRYLFLAARREQCKQDDVDHRRRARRALLAFFEMVEKGVQFVEGRALRAGRLERQLQAKRRKQPGNLGKAQLSGASVFQRVQRGAADARLAREFGLTQFERLAALGDLAANGDETEHMPSILGIRGIYKLIA